MKHIRQPHKSVLCGQCALAMATGLDLKTVISVMGRGRTTYAGLQRALKVLKFRGHLSADWFVGPIVQRRSSNTDWPDDPYTTYIVRITHPVNTHLSHFVIYRDGKVWDSVFARSYTLKNWLKRWERIQGIKNVKPTSWAYIDRVMALQLESIRDRLPVMFKNGRGLRFKLRTPILSLRGRR